MWISVEPHIPSDVVCLELREFRGSLGIIHCESDMMIGFVHFGSDMMIGFVRVITWWRAFLSFPLAKSTG